MNKRQKLHSLSLALGLALVALAFLLVGMSRAETSVDVVVPSAARSATASEGGIAAFTVTQLHAGFTETFCLVYTATGSITTTGSIRVIDPDFHGTRWTMWQECQDASPTTPGYLTVTTTGSAALDIKRHQAGAQNEAYTTIRVTSGELELGAAGDPEHR